MRLPKFITKAVVRQLLVVPSGWLSPYWHLDGYMRRWWLLGAASVERNQGNPSWRQSPVAPPDGVTPRGKLYQWVTHWIAARLHVILRPDSDRHLHDHPWWSLSIVLDGGYWEVVPALQGGSIRPGWLHEMAQEAAGTEATAPDAKHFHVTEPCVVKWRGPGSIVFRRATARHKLVLPESTILGPGNYKPAVSVFVMGRKTNSWGFYTPEGKVYYKTYLGLAGDDQ